jgi:hypothetical protein
MSKAPSGKEYVFSASDFAVKQIAREHNTERSIKCGASLFSYLQEETTHIIQTIDKGQLRCPMIEFALLAGR